MNKMAYVCNDTSVRKRYPALSQSLLRVLLLGNYFKLWIDDVENVCVGVKAPQPSRSSGFILFICSLPLV